MPRSCPQPQEQSLQGNLFGAPEPTDGSAADSSKATQALTAEALAEFSDADLSADAASRPRQRQGSDPVASSNEVDDLNSSENDDSDEPAWAHHSQVDQMLLTPMLRHYVELKAEHPERVLLYRLGDVYKRQVPERPWRNRLQTHQWAPGPRTDFPAVTAPGAGGRSGAWEILKLLDRTDAVHHKL